jgi:type IV pilus assembly protein PilB
MRGPTRGRFNRHNGRRLPGFLAKHRPGALQWPAGLGRVNSPGRPGKEVTLSDTTVIRSAANLADSKRILDVLLRSLIQKKTITPADLQTVLGATIRRVADTVFAQAITIFMLDKTTNRIRFQNVYYAPALYGADAGRKKLFEQKARQLETITLAPDQGIVGQVVASGKSRLIADVSKEQGHYGKIDETTGFQTRSMITVPLLVGEKAVGAIQVLNKCQDSGDVTAFTQDDVGLLEDVASYSAKIIQRALDPDTPLSNREMALYVARLSRNDFMELGPEFEPNLVMLKNIGEEVLKRYQILPLEQLGPKELRVGMANPLDFQTVQDFELATGFKIRQRVVIAASEIEEALLKVFPETTTAQEVTQSVLQELETGETAEVSMADEDDENSAPIVRLSNTLIEEAYSQGASDIHIEPQENKVMVRYRIDGVCREKHSLPKAAARPLVARLKIMSDLDIAEHRLPQDGRIVFKKFNSKYDMDLRVSVAPMNHGEKVCMRILDKSKSTLPLDKLGFSKYNLELYRRLIQAPYGMVLHCGPTGSGKSMTLYAALNEINSPEWNIQTAEDPIEYTLPGLNQLQVRKDIGLTFAAALRSFLRQDPDIILVGEIRDEETAEIAVEAALTGHLLFSTLHTNDAPSTITRLVEIGIEPFMISTSLICICAQRLMRRLCPCAIEEEPKPDELALLKRAKDESPPGRIRQPAGCPKCGKSGYKGRTGIHEILTVSEELRQIISKGGTAEVIKLAARRAGMRTLFEDSMEKVKLGITSLTEALGTARPDDDEVAPAAGAPGA